MNTKTEKSTGNLLGDALENVSSLVRNEVDLARAEVSENVNKAGSAIVYIIIAIVLAITALNVLVGSLIGGLVELGLDDGLAALIIGVLIAVLAYILARSGVKALKLTSLAPTRAAKNIKRDAQTITERSNDK